jgi:hypothetical protein
MAIISESVVQQSTREIRRWTADFTDDLPTGGSITAGTAFHTPPSGTAGSVTVTYTNTTVTATLGPLSVVGIHYLDIQATCSNNEKSEVRIEFTVNYPTETARASMADLITNLRSLTNAGALEYTVAGNPFWTDKQLQTVLDRHVTYIRDEVLRPLETISAGGSTSYFDYQSSYRFLESTVGGTSRFIVKDETYTAIGTAAYTVDYPRGFVTFGTTTTGLTRYLTGYSYDLNAAAADVWSQKAAHYVTSYDVQTDNHGLKRSQIIQNCLTMAKNYSSGAMVFSVSVDRSDTVGCNYDTN